MGVQTVIFVIFFQFLLIPIARAAPEAHFDECTSVLAYGRPDGYFLFFFIQTARAAPKAHFDEVLAFWPMGVQTIIL